MDSPVEVTLEDGRLVIAATAEPPYSLDDLLAQMTDENLHDEIDTGPATGNEIW